MITVTDGLTQALANTDDPETIRHIINAATNSETETNWTSNGSPPSLESLYDRYLNRRKNNSPTTIAQYRRTIPGFVDFAAEHDVKSPTGLTTELVDQFVDKLYRQYYKDATILVHTKNVRAWLNWLNTRDYCPESVVAILNKDELGLEPTARDDAIPESEANHILDQLSSNRRGTVQHALFELIWNGGPRLGGIHSTDVRDFFPNEGILRVRHRPDSGTRLKNGEDGNRNIVLKDRVVDAIELYLSTERIDVEDAHGRRPLFSTGYGRAAKSTLRRWIYDVTSCRWAPESGDHYCDCSCDPDTDVCPYSYYPHAIRRGAIVRHLSGGLALDKASERFDVSPSVIKAHYDPRTESRRLEDRIDAVRNAWRN